jgi:hypothetical protein
MTCLTLHFFLFHHLSNDEFVSHIVNNRCTLQQPIYQKSVFEKLAFGVETDFTSRVYGTTNKKDDIESMVAFLMDLASDETGKKFHKFVKNDKFGFVSSDIDRRLSFELFKSMVINLNGGSFSDILDKLVTLNNRVVSDLDRVTSFHSNFTVVTEVYTKKNNSQLGLFKFRNLTPDSYAVQEKG